MGNLIYVLGVLLGKFVLFLDKVFGGLAGWILLLILLGTIVGLAVLVWRTSWKKFLIGLGVVVLAVAAAAVIVSIPRRYNPRPLQFDGNSKQLQRTQIVSTLDAPVERGKNVVWCASFQAAWKKLQTDLAKEPVILTGAETACAALNASPMPEVPEGELYTAAGWEDQGIIEEIRRKKERMFPGSAVPQFPSIMPGSFVAYAYLHSRCKFDYPYFDSTSPLKFADSAGNTSPIRTFGIREEGGRANKKLRAQVEILYSKGDAQIPEEFALDLCRNSEPTQVVFARVPLEESLQATLVKLEEKTASYGRTDYERNFGLSNILLVPEIAYKLMHNFADLERKGFENATMAGHSMDVAQQEIEFRLDHSGAEIISEAIMAEAAIPSLYVADGPFLIYLKKRGAQMPYFAMWVDNDELLTKWQ